MKAVVLLVVGVAVGFVAAHQLSRTPQGQDFFADVETKARGFGEAVVDGYKTREAELRSAAEGFVSDLSSRAK